MIKVSVIIPVYNVFPYLDACLDSVLAQTLHDIEILCIDDCSTDDSLLLLRRYAETDPRIRVLANDENRNVSFTRNRGIREARGDYVFFMDSDDLLAGNGALEALYAAAVEDHADVVLGRVINWYEDRETIDESVCPLESFRGSNVVAHPFFARHVTPWNKLLRRAVLLEHGIFFDESLHKFEDNDFSCRTVVHAGRLSYVAVSTYRYRQRTGGDKSKMYTRSCEDAFWKCHAALNMAVAVREAEPGVRRVYAENIGDMLRGAYQDFIRYGDGRVEPFLEALGKVFRAMPADVSDRLPAELYLSREALQSGNAQAAWTPLHLYKKARLFFYLRYAVPFVRHCLKKY